MRIGRIIDALSRRRDKARRKPEDCGRGHIASYTEAVVYFTFVFGSAPLSPHKFAQRLLAAELAETVTSSADGEVHMAPRYDKLVRLIRKAEQIKEMSRAEADGTLMGWARKHPAQAAVLITSVLATKVRRALGQSDDSSVAEAVEDDANAGVDALMSNTVADINKSIAHRQALNAIQHAREQDMYQPGYLESEPYLRLTLRKVNFGLTGFSEKDEIANGQSSDVLLLVHRSGVLQLTMAVRMPEGLHTDEVIPRTTASGVGLSWSEVAEPVLEAASRRTGADRRQWPGDWLPDIQDGTRWRRLVHAAPVSLVDLFRLYQDAIRQVSTVDLGDEWHCYPVVCLDRPGCCGSGAAWTAQHQGELSGILTRYEGYEQLRESSLLKLPADSSITEGRSVWHSRASTTLISWTGEPQRFDDHLWMLLVTENYLLQYWQLRALSKSLQIVGTEPTAKAARYLQRRLIFGLEEVYLSSLTYGTAQEAVDILLQESGAERMRDLMVDRLGQLGSIDAAERAERAAARTTAAAAAAFAAAVVFGLPAIDQTLELASAIPERSVAGQLASPLRAVTDLGTAGSFLCYLGLLAVLLIAALLYSLPRRRSRRGRVRRAGRPWPSGTIQVVRRDRDEDVEHE